jgi:hypothetical protein
MEIRYKLYSVWLYDHELKHDYVLFYNVDLPIQISGYRYSALGKIYELQNKNSIISTSDETVEIMLSAAKESNVLMVKTSDFIDIVCSDRISCHSSYKAYDIYWNETKSGINPHEYEKMAVWNIGSSSYTSYRIHQYKEEREKVYKAICREQQIKTILDD